LKGKFLAAFIFVGYLVLQSCLQISHFFRFLEKKKKKGPYIFEIIVPKIIIDKICNKSFSTERNLFAPKFIIFLKKKSDPDSGWLDMPCHDTYIFSSPEQSNLNTDAAGQV
jgi:hypothetical protein